LYKDAIEIMPQLVAQLYSIPWGHYRCIIDKCKNANEALFFVQKTQENNWARDVLSNFLGTNLFKREGKAIGNFDSIANSLNMHSILAKM